MERHPDKKQRDIDFNRVTNFLREAQEIGRNFEVGQKEATWIPQAEYPELPIVLLLASDIHYGSIHTDYNLLEKHLDIVENTPNIFMATNGDHVDNFNPNIHPTGMTENPIPPQMQGRVFAQKLLDLDKKGKIAVMGQGNHDDFGFAASGQDHYESFYDEMTAPIFTQGGMLSIVTRGATYDLLMNHTFWGNSKLNPTNAPKRMLEYEGGGRGDISWVGHCFADDVEILTPQGWIKGIDLKKNDKVGTMNLESGDFEFNRVEHKVEYDDYTELIHFKNKRVDIRVTDKHTMIYSNAYKTPKWLKTDADILKKRKSPFLLPLAAKNKAKDLDISDDMIRLTGWLISEGHFRDNGAVQLFQNVGEKANIIKRLLKRIGIKHSTYLKKDKGRKFLDPRTGKEYQTKGDALAFYITIKDSKPIVSIIREKRLPKWAFSLSKRQVEILLEAMCLGDGSIRKDGNRDNMTYYSADEYLLDQIQMLCAMNNLRSKINTVKQYIMISRTPYLRCFQKVDMSITNEKYSGKVWCVSVKNKTLVVRNKGRVLITGNTHQSTYEHFERGGKDRIAVVSGTYKTDDPYAAKRGIGGRGQDPGIAVMLWQDKRKMEAFKDIEVAQQLMLGLIFDQEQAKSKKKRIYPR